MDALPLRPPPLPRLNRADMLRLITVRNLPNLTKIPLFLGLMVAAGWVAWTTTSSVALWTAYVALGYLWMGIVTFMHDGTHDTLFARPWLNTAFGVVAMIPMASPSSPSSGITSSIIATTARRATPTPSRWAGAAWPISCCSTPT